MSLDSIWSKEVTLPSFSTLKENLQTEVVVIGGGLAGILTAYFLQQEGVETVLLEADRIGSGQTARTTAKLTAQHGLKYHQLLKTLGIEAAGQYARANLSAVAGLRRLVQNAHIDCDFQDCATHLYAIGAPGPLQEEYNACRALGMDVFFSHNTELPFAAQTLGLRNQACFHPLKLLAGLSKGLTVYEHSRVLKVEGHTAYTAHGSVTAKKVIFTCHYPFLNVPGYYFLRQHQERSYVLTLENTETMQDCYLGIDGSQLSFRPYGKYLLLGGAGHRTGENPDGQQYEDLLKAAKTYWPQCRVAAQWSAQDCMPMDKVPFIGIYAESRPDWLVATGFQKWGMSSSVVAAGLLRELAMGRPAPAGCAVFSPHRFHAGASSRQLLDDTRHAVQGISRTILKTGAIPVETLPKGQGAIVKLRGEVLGVYRDEDDVLHAVSPKCPHLGCRLAWNGAEKTWDCPCHGSRFDIHGQLLDGPAQTQISHPL